MSRSGGKPGAIWRRRNWWGLAAVLPLVVAVVALSPNDSYEVWRNSEPREAVRPDADGWVSYGGTRVRLAALAPAKLIDAISQEEFRLTPGLRAWQATITFERLTDPDDSLLLCKFLLEDDLGRTYGDGPRELDHADLPGGESYFPSICRPEPGEEDAATFDAIALFVLPSSADPVALWLTASDQLPRYAWLPVG